MRDFSIRFDTYDRLDHVLGSIRHDVTETPNGHLLTDPAGNNILLSSA